jgi:biofilm PGA synthesis N-glycosyltransferase PgaC
MIIAFWISLFIVLYTFVGYGFLLYFIIKIKRIFKGKPVLPVVADSDLPTCTLVVAAYN